MDDDPLSDHAGLDGLSDRMVAPPFIAPEILDQLEDASRKEKLAQIIETEIITRLVALHSEPLHEAYGDNQMSLATEIEELAKLTLLPDIGASSRYVSSYISSLKDRGLSADGLFVNLLEPTARQLGTMWENDECDFVDVTFGVARLQQLLSIFNCSFSVPAFVEKRTICMMTIADEKHSFGVSMVEKFLRAGGWRVHSERGAALGQIPSLVQSEWYAVAGLTIGTERRVDELSAVVRSIRQHSRNPSIGIMVGGPPFNEDPTLAARVGADATALNAPTAVLLAQKLFDMGARTNWQNSYV